MSFFLTAFVIKDTTRLRGGLGEIERSVLTGHVDAPDGNRLSPIDLRPEEKSDTVCCDYREKV